MGEMGGVEETLSWWPTAAFVRYQDSEIRDYGVQNMVRQGADVAATEARGRSYVSVCPLEPMSMPMRARFL